jgi:hypothetical protein
VKPEAAETFWQRFWATYKFRRNFGREGWWRSFGGRSGQLGAIELRKNRGRHSTDGTFAEKLRLSGFEALNEALDYY